MKYVLRLPIIRNGGGAFHFFQPDTEPHVAHDSVTPVKVAFVLTADEAKQFDSEEEATTAISEALEYYQTELRDYGNDAVTVEQRSHLFLQFIQVVPV